MPAAACLRHRRLTSFPPSGSPPPLSFLPPSYVPWVLVNGIPLGQLDAQLLRIVCLAFSGKRPAACYAPPDAAAAPLGRTAAA